jgi:uncharacterized membrane protein YkvA (DUF1232 family)
VNTEDIDDILRSKQDSRSREDVRSQFWRKVKRTANQIPFMDEVVAAYFCAMDPQTPTRVRGILLAALAYFILPLDAVPDFLLFFGFSDDIAVLTAAFATVRGEITEAHRKAAREALREDQVIDPF